MCDAKSGFFYFLRFFCGLFRSFFVLSANKNLSSGKEMNFFEQLIPRYLLTKRNQVLMVTSAAALALIFIIIYKPFGSGQWGDNMEVSDFMFFIYSLLIVLLGMSIVALSRIAMFQYTKKHEITYLSYGIWVFVELVMMAVAYTICCLISGTQSDTWSAFNKALYHSSLTLFIPYIIIITTLSLQDKNKRLQQMEEDLDQAALQKAAGKSLISFYDDRGELQLSVTKENLLYIEAADNYVQIWYMKNNLPKKQILRNTLKRTEELLAPTNIMRCHRGYMVNMEQVKVLRREKEGFYLELGINNVPDIPVSKTYGKSVLKWLALS